MDKTDKFLKQLPQKEFVAVQKALEKILSSNTEALDVKRLLGYRDVYRVRVRDFRIIFVQHETDIEVLEINRRSEKTYRNLR